MVTLTRAEAGRRLAVGLGAMVKEVPVVLALSPGGARVASEIAREFEAPLDVIPVRRLEVSGRPRSTFGAVADGTTLILSDRVAQLGLPDDYVSAMADLAHREIDLLASAWRGGAPPVNLTGRTALLVDDGLSDAVAVAAAAHGVRELGARRVIYAAPGASRAFFDAVRPECDDCIMLFDDDASAKAFVCDPDFSQTTRFDVRSMVRHSRPDFAAVVGP
jgi:predicted phosphoribosyltransferase